MPIKIHTFRKSFRELQVGDQFLVIHGGWGYRGVEVRAVYRITDRHFIWGYGDKKPSGLFENQIKYSRDNGRKQGEPFRDSATLPTPELIAELNAEMLDAENRCLIRDTNWKLLTNAQAASICKLLKSFEAPNDATREATPVTQG